MLGFLQCLTSFWIIGFGFFVWFCLAYAKAWGSHKFSKGEIFGLIAIPAMAMLVPLLLPVLLPESVLANDWLLALLMILGTLVLQVVAYYAWLISR